MVCPFCCFSELYQKADVAKIWEYTKTLTPCTGTFNGDTLQHFESYITATDCKAEIGFAVEDFVIEIASLLHAVIM